MKSRKVGNGIDRRRFLEGSALVGVGTACTALGLTGRNSVYAAERSGCHGHTKYFSYPPYDSAAENDAAYAQYVSAWHVAILGSWPLNIHYGKRKNGRIQDVYTKRWYWDCHRNGSKFNLGHRNPDLVKAMREAIDQIDAGSFAQLSGYRAKTAEKLVASTDGQLTGVTFGLGGADAIEIAIHAARNHTGRRGLVAISNTSFHGSTDLTISINGISGEYRDRYLVDASNTTFVPYNDLAAMQDAISEETAAVVMEPSPAQGGFPVPSPGYLEGIREACDANGAVFILDEVQTGLGATGTFWAYQQYDFVPDVVVVAKGIGGGLYPISAAIMAEPVWNSFNYGQILPHESTYAGAEIGCVVASTVLDISTDPAFLARVREVANRFAIGFADAPFEVTQLGLCMGLRTPDPLQASFQLANEGVLALPSFVDSVVIFRPVLTLRDEEVDEIIAAVRRGLG